MQQTERIINNNNNNNNYKMKLALIYYLGGFSNQLERWESDLTTFGGKDSLLLVLSWIVILEYCILINISWPIADMMLRQYVSGF